MGLFKGEVPVFARLCPFGRRGVRRDAVSPILGLELVLRLGQYGRPS